VGRPLDELHVLALQFVNPPRDIHRSTRRKNFRFHVVDVFSHGIDHSEVLVDGGVHDRVQDSQRSVLTQGLATSQSIPHRAQITVWAVSHGHGVVRPREHGHLTGIYIGSVIVVPECLHDSKDGSSFGDVDLGSLPGVGRVVYLQPFKLEYLSNGLEFGVRRIDEANPYEAVLVIVRCCPESCKLRPNLFSRRVLLIGYVPGRVINRLDRPPGMEGAQSSDHPCILPSANH